MRSAWKAANLRADSRRLQRVCLARAEPRQAGSRQYLVITTASSGVVNSPIET